VKSLVAASLRMVVQEPDVDPARVPEASAAPIRRHRGRDRNRLDGVGDQPSPSRQAPRGFAQLVDVVGTDDMALARIAESGPGGVRVIEGLGQFLQGLLGSRVSQFIGRRLPMPAGLVLFSRVWGRGLDLGEIVLR